MDTVSPVVADATQLLHMDLHSYLDDADFLSLNYQKWTQQDADSARKLIPDLVEVIRGLLIAHEATPTGHCRDCPSSTWPCPVVTTIHALVKDPDRAFAALLRRARNG